MQPGQIGPLSHSRAVAWATRLALCLAVHGCSTATGGAVELSWKLKAASGSNANFIDCSNTSQLPPPPQLIRLRWQDAGNDGGFGFAQWDCSDGHGVTGFALAPGQALLDVVPICPNGQAPPADTYSAPAPVQRAVIAGDTIDLNAIEIVLQTSSCNLQPCACQ